MTLSQKKLPVLGFFRERLDTDEFNFKTSFYEQAHHELLDLLEEQGVYVAVLMGQSSYLGNGIFSKHWIQTKVNGEYRFEKRGEIKVGVIWVKDQFEAQDVPQINSPDFRRICSDKNLTYEFLASFQPQRHLVQNEVDFTTAVNAIPGEKIVIKILTGNSGLGVFVGDKADFKKSDFNHPFPWQVQEFIETSGGIPNLVNGRHDFRVIVINGQPELATLRTPPAGGFKSNIGYNGETRLIEAADIPINLLPLLRKIDRKLASISQDRFYSADFGLTSDGWRLYEINAMPGTIDRKRGEPAAIYQKKLAEFLAMSAKKYSKEEKSKKIIGRNVRISFGKRAVDVPAKIDTGADGSAVWASKIKVDENGVLTFALFGKKSPYYNGKIFRRTDYSVAIVKSSSGHETIKYRTHFTIKIAGKRIRAVFGLSDRSKHDYPVLIGCRTIKGKFLVDVSDSDYIIKKKAKQTPILNRELRADPVAFYKKYHKKDVKR